MVACNTVEKMLSTSTHSFITNKAYDYRLSILFAIKTRRASRLMTFQLYSSTSVGTRGNMKKRSTLLCWDYVSTFETEGSNSIGSEGCQAFRRMNLANLFSLNLCKRAKIKTTTTLVEKVVSIWLCFIAQSSKIFVYVTIRLITADNDIGSQGVKHLAQGTWNNLR